MKKRYQSFGYSFLVIGVLIALHIFAGSRSQDPFLLLGWCLMFFVFYCPLALGCSLLLLILRATRVLKRRDHFIYVFSASISFVFGAAAVVFLWNTSIREPLILLATANLLSGYIQAIDIFSKSSVAPGKQ